MTRNLHRLIALAVCMLMTACTTEHAAQNVYEGIQNRDQGLKTPAEKATTPPPPSYPDYEAERKRLHGDVQD
jgi:hypothetical protein